MYGESNIPDLNFDLTLKNTPIQEKFYIINYINHASITIFADKGGSYDVV